MAQCLGLLAPTGRDASVIQGILASAEIRSRVARNVDDVLADLANAEIGALIIAAEALDAQAQASIENWLASQPPWSDLPIIVLTMGAAGRSARPASPERLGNVTILERPLHPLTLVSAARAALRARARQHQAEEYVTALAAERAALAQSEQRLRDSEARYRALFSSMDEGFCIIQFIDGPDGPMSDYVHVEANDAYERHAGLTNVVGKSVRELVPGEAEGWIELYREVLATGGTIRFERELTATGRFLELSAFRVEPARRRQVAVVFQDITDRKKTESALLELNETLERRVEESLAERKLLADLVDGTDAFVQVADRNFRWLAINRAAKDEFERIFGIRPQVGQSMLDALSDMPEHRAAVQAVWQRALNGEQFTEIGEFGDPGRDRRFYEMKYNVLRDRNGEQIGAYQFVYDVTERLRDQERLAEATARVHEMAKLETLGQLTGGVAHDFNNLLTPIVGTLDMLRRKHEEDPRSTRLIFGAMQAAERASILVQRLLTFARRQHLEAKAVDIGALVAGLRDMVQRSIGPHIPIRLEVAPGLPAAHIDPNQLELAVLNLAVNARDAMPSGGSLTIKVDAQSRSTPSRDGMQPGQYVRLSVSDTGVGMDAETLRRAIEPFFTTKGIGKGTGLGLSMIHGLAAQSGGALRLHSRAGAGTTAELWLPVATESADTVQSTTAAMPTQPRRATVLLVDDEDLVRSATAEMIRDMGHIVIEQGSPIAALEMLEGAGPVDLLVTDYLMPQMRGGELANRAQALRPGLPVLLITGYAEMSDGEGTDLPRLAKPFREADLATLVARLLADDKVIDMSARRRFRKK